MAATSFGIVYATGSKMILRVFMPDSDAELQSVALRPGESLLVTPQGPNDLFTCQALVKAATGVTPLDSRHAVVDGNGNVIAIDHVEPTLDGPSLHPGMTLVQSHVAAVGMTFSPAVGFTIPAHVLPVGTMIKQADGSRKPSPTAIPVAALVLPNTATTSLPSV
jgi:hypothetical protein